jgi:hypothetical protein
VIFDQFFFGSEEVTCAIYFHKMHLAEMFSFCIRTHPFESATVILNSGVQLFMHSIVHRATIEKKMICIMKALK